MANVTILCRYPEFKPVICELIFLPITEIFWLPNYSYSLPNCSYRLPNCSYRLLSFGLVLWYKFTLVQQLHYILKFNHFEWRLLIGPFRYEFIHTVRLLSILLSSLMRNDFPKRQSGAPLHTLSTFYMIFPLVLNTPTLFEAVYVLLYLQSPKGGCYSISDDLSCSNQITKLFLPITKLFLPIVKFWISTLVFT